MASQDARAEIHDFSLPASTGQTLGLDSFKGKVPLVLLFLDHEADEDRALLSELNARHKDFGSERSQILVVLRVTARMARQIADDMDLSVPLLADASGAMARDYGAENGIDGRIAFLADRDGRLARRFDPSALDGDPSAVTGILLDEVRAISSGDQSGE